MRKHCLLLICILTTSINLKSQESFNSCLSAEFICSKSFSTFNMNKEITMLELPKTECFPVNELTGSFHWLKFKIESSGSLEFVITPSNLTDDFDFIVYKTLNNGTCQGLTSIKCMASGSNYGDYLSTDNRCKGLTGLRSNSIDNIESKGCFGDADNFLSSIITKKNDEYYILVINNSSKAGYGIEFSGSCQLSSQIIGLNSIKADKLLEKDDLYNFSLDELSTKTLSEIYWDFGNSSFPSTAFGPGPHTVLYESSGIKKVTITSKTKSNCIGNYSFDINVKKSKNNNKVYFGKAYPNPTQSFVSIPYHTSDLTIVNIEIFDIKGGLVQKIDRQTLSKTGIINFNASSFTDGIYLVSISEIEKGKNLHSALFAKN